MIIGPFGEMENSSGRTSALGAKFMYLDRGLQSPSLTFKTPR